MQVFSNSVLPRTQAYSQLRRTIRTNVDTAQPAMLASSSSPDVYFGLFGVKVPRKVIIPAVAVGALAVFSQVVPTSSDQVAAEPFAGYAVSPTYNLDFRLNSYAKGDQSPKKITSMPAINLVDTRLTHIKVGNETKNYGDIEDLRDGVESLLSTLDQAILSDKKAAEEQGDTDREYLGKQEYKERVSRPQLGVSAIQDKFGVLNIFTVLNPDEAKDVTQVVSLNSGHYAIVKGEKGFGGLLKGDATGTHIQILAPIGLLEKVAKYLAAEGKDHPIRSFDDVTAILKQANSPMPWTD